jgi:hypothetical protein
MTIYGVYYTNQSITSMLRTNLDNHIPPIGTTEVDSMTMQTGTDDRHSHGSIGRSLERRYDAFMSGRTSGYPLGPRALRPAERQFCDSTLEDGWTAEDDNREYFSLRNMQETAEEELALLVADQEADMAYERSRQPEFDGEPDEDHPADPGAWIPTYTAAGFPRTFEDLSRRDLRLVTMEMFGDGRGDDEPVYFDQIPFGTHPYEAIPYSVHECTTAFHVCRVQGDSIV